MTTSIRVDYTPPSARILFATEPAGKPPALNYAVLDQFEEAIAEVRSRIPEIRVLCIESSETKYFVVGADLKALQELDHESIRPWVQRGHDVFNLLGALKIPVIAVVRGFAGGGGLELALACDFIYAADNARFALPEAGLGLVPGWGGSYRLPARIGAARAKELAFSAQPVDAATAFSMGLVNFYGSEEELSSRLAEFTAAVEANSQVSLAMEKSLINAAEALALERMKFEEAAASTSAMSSGDTARRLSEFFEKRARRKGAGTA
jgi:enoyl-CoA hydratase